MSDVRTRPDIQQRATKPSIVQSVIQRVKAQRKAEQRAFRLANHRKYDLMHWFGW